MRRLASALLSFTAAMVFAPSVPAQTNSQKPNVVLIITDDVGYGDFGSYGAPDVKTPNIDRLARQGVRLTNFYANATLCTPTRAGLISGRYQQRAALEQALGGASTSSFELGLRATGRSLPQLLKNNGYATALIGKWHLGYKPEFSPLAHGFDYYWGFKSGYVDYYTHTDGAGRPDLFEGDSAITASGYMTDLITERSLTFLSNVRQPFFLEVAYSAAHWPYQPPDRPAKARNNAAHLLPHDSATSTRADYIAMLERADQGVGRILQLLEQLRLTQNTIVIFTNDNGGEWLSRNTPLFHRKWTLWEGGIRVPAIVRWPGHIPAGRVSHQVGITMDLTTSILAATNSTVPADARLEGMNIFPILEGRAAQAERTLFWRTAVGGFQQRAVRSGNWKLLIDGNAVLLFDLQNDIGERNDLAARRPDIAQKLRRLLADWERDVNEEAQRLRATGTSGTD